MQAEYFKLYNYTALALKRVSDEFKVGGPVVSLSNHYYRTIIECSAEGPRTQFMLLTDCWWRLVEGVHFLLSGE